MRENNNIPKHWNATKVSEIGDLIRGVNYKKEESSSVPIENYLPIFRGNNINGELNFDNLVYVNKNNISTEQLVQKDDIVIAMSSGSKHLVGKSAKAKTNFNGGFGAFCGVFRACKDVNKSFVAYFFQSPYYKKTISEVSKGSNINNLKREHILNLDFPTPPFQEQQAIVSKIEELLSDLENGKQQLQIAKQQLKVYRQSLLKWAFEGRFGFAQRPGESVKDGELPKGWKWVKINTLLSDSKKGMATGPFGTMLKKSEHQKKGIPVLGIENIGEGVFQMPNKIFITKEKAIELKSFRVKENDIIISRSGTVGEICLLPKKMENSIISTNLIRVSLNGTVIYPKYFVYLFQGGKVRQQVFDLCKGSSRAFLNQTILNSLDFPFCSLKEQQFIVDELESKLTVCDKIEETITQSLQQAETLRQSILKKAFEGKLV